MAYQATRISFDPANVLPGGVSATALATGDLVYLASTGKWTLAVSGSQQLAAASRTDALGVIVNDVGVNMLVSPVKKASIKGYSGLVIGARQYLSATGTTGNTVTATMPSATIVQVVGVAILATEMEFDVAPAWAAIGGITIGANSSASGSGVKLTGVSPYTSVFQAYADDGGVALGAGDSRTIKGRYLLTTAITLDASAAGVLGQLKAIGVSIGGAGVKCGVKGYIETITGFHAAGGLFHAVEGVVDLPTGGVIDATIYMAAFGAWSNDLGGTHTGKAVVLDVPTPLAGTWDALLHVKSDSGATGTTYGAIDANKCLLVYYNDTVMKIPLYATA
jgi:hypothetical protein